VKLVLTVLARDEEDIVEAQIAFHLNAGVDLVVATDNRSRDGTTQILERFAGMGCLLLLREEGEDNRQGEWLTRMARFAARELGADWVINADADEFWWPHGGDLKEVLAAVPERYGIVRGFWREFLPRPGDGIFAERMTVRLSPYSNLNSTDSPFHPQVKNVHRADPEAVIQFGNHEVAGPRLELLRDWYPFEVLHFPLRTYEQTERKFAQAGRALSASADPARSDHTMHAYALYQEGRLRDFYESFELDDAALEQGLAGGSLVVDARLRDALRTLRTPGSDGFLLPGEGAPKLSFPRLDLAAESAYAADTAVLNDPLERVTRRVDALERRAAGLRTATAVRLRKGLRRPV
jgi:hypothetical protein